jgi:hypothetical protein
MDSPVIRDSHRNSFRTLGLGAVAAVAVSLAVPATASAQSLDELGRPTEPVLQAIENLSEQQWIPESTRGTIARVVGFFRGSGEPGTPLPENGPRIAQFAYPTIMQECIDGEKTAVGAATAVPGKADLPLPGIPAGELGFIFTALGTEGVADHQVQPMTVDWYNVNNGRRGSTVLTYNGINEGGPATLNGTAQTGAGQVLMLLQGGVTTKLTNGGTSNCVAFPTVGTALVP